MRHVWRGYYKEADTQVAPFEQLRSVPVQLADAERVSRFLFSRKNDFSPSRKLVKPSAFDPYPYNELSVAHSTGLTEAEVWAVGELVREACGRPVVYACADIDVAHISEQKLRAMRDDQPFQRHTNVLGWPSLENKDDQKRLCKGIATQLASRASLTLKPLISGQT